MKLDSRKPELLYDQMLKDSGITREKFDGYKVGDNPLFTVEPLTRMLGETSETYVLAKRGHKYVGQSDYRYLHRETAEIVAKTRNLWNKPPRERGVYRDDDAAAKAWAKLSGQYVGGGGGWIFRAVNGNRAAAKPSFQGWGSLAVRLQKQGKIEAAGFGRYRIAADEIERFTPSCAILEA